MSRKMPDPERQETFLGNQARIAYILVLLVLLSWLLRLYQIDLRSIWWDESLSLYRAQHNWQYILSNRIDFPGIRTTDQHPPLYFALLSLATRLAGESDLVLRLPSAAFATLIIPLLYALGARLRSRRLGLVAALLAALSPLYQWYAQEARMYTLVTALGVLSLYCLLRVLSNRGAGRSTRLKWYVLTVVSVICGLVTQYLFALSLAAAAPLLVVAIRGQSHRAPEGPRHGHHPRRRTRWWLAIAGLAIVGLTLLGLGWQVRDLLPSLGNYRGYVPLGVILRDAINSFSLGLSVNLRKVWLLDMAFVAVYAVGLVSVWRRPLALPDADAQHVIQRLASLLLIAGFLLLPALLLWMFSLLFPVYTSSRYLIVCSPIFYLGLALGVEALRRWWRPLGLISLAMLLLGMGFSLARYFWHPYYRVKENYADAIALIERDERPHDVIVVNGPENAPAFEHYYRGQSPVISLPTGGMSREQLEAALSEITQEYERVWLLKARTTVSDPDRVVAQWLEDNTMRVLAKGYPSCGNYVSLLAFAAHHPVEPAADKRPLALLDDRLALLEVRLSHRSADGQIVDIKLIPDAAEASIRGMVAHIAAGNMLAAQFLWEPQSALGDYKTSLRLVAADATWAQRDRVPFTYLSTRDWPADRAVRHTADLPIPGDLPAGCYALRLVVYEAETGVPLAVTAPASSAPQFHLDLCQIEVTRSDSEWRPSELDDDVIPRMITAFGPLQVVGYSMNPDKLLAGDKLTLHLAWQLRHATQSDYQIVVNLRDAEGRVWHTSRQLPTGTDYATSQWMPGQRVRGIVPLDLPKDAPVGSHSVHLLVYDPSSQSFAWLRRGLFPATGRDLVLGTIEIGDQ